jgi:sulfate permease, SulP family
MATFQREFIEFVKNNKLDFFPIRGTLRSYSKGKFLADLRAGLNVALLAFPQGMAYAMIAGLPIQYGLYASAIAAVVGPIFASSRLTVVGPTNATAVMVLSTFLLLPPGMDRIQCASLLVVLVGVFLLLGAYIKVASLTQFVSRSVVIGYITGAALLIIANQVHHVLGYPIGDVDTFFAVGYETIRRLGEVEVATLTLGLMTFLCYFCCSRYLKKLPGVVVTLVIMAFTAEGFRRLGFQVDMLNPVPQGFWPFTPPKLDLSWAQILATPAIGIAFLAMLEGSFMSKSLASRSGERVDVNQEMLSFGAANIFSGLFGGMPASGSLTRSTLNWTSGAASCMASVFSGVLCAIGVLSCGNLVKFVPKTSLAVVVICIAITLVNFKQIRIAWRSTKSDATVLGTTFAAALLAPLYFAIFLGTAVSVILFLRKAGRPQLAEYAFNDEGQLCELDAQNPREDPNISIVHVEGDLFFGAAELFQNEIQRVSGDPNLKVIILRLKNARNLDATSVMALEELVLYLRGQGRHLLVSGATREVFRILKGSGVMDILGRHNLFMASLKNPNMSTRNALKRAQEILGVKDPPVRIFYDSSEKTRLKL